MLDMRVIWPFRQHGASGGGGQSFAPFPSKEELCDDVRAPLGAVGEGR